MVRLRKGALTQQGVNRQFDQAAKHRTGEHSQPKKQWQDRGRDRTKTETSASVEI